MSDKMREEFESWVIKQNICVKYGAKLIQCRDGSYKDYRINDRWISWQASRATQCVELSRYVNNNLDGGFIYEEAAKAMLDAEGVRYK